MNEEMSGFKRFLKSFWGEVLQIVILAVIIVVPFRAYIAQPFIVSGPSMDDTFADGQYLIVDELTYERRTPHRGEVVIFHPPNKPSVYYIKRLIGLPGETIQIKGDKITICQTDCATDKDKFTLEEPYVKINELLPRPDETITLKTDEYFVMGDNRSVSQDSRIFGPVKRSAFLGRPFLRLLPLSKLGVFPGQVIEEK
jgi:signal peptidase I